VSAVSDPHPRNGPSVDFASTLVDNDPAGGRENSGAQKPDEELAQTTHHVRSYPWAPGDPISELPKESPPKSKSKAKPGAAPRSNLPAPSSSSDLPLKIGIGVVAALIAVLALVLVLELAGALTAELPDSRTEQTEPD
jgi:hypothetical protein